MQTGMRGTDPIHLANGESKAQGILLMQVLQQLAVHTVLNGVHHLSFCLNGSPLLLYASGKELSLKSHFF